MLHALVQQFVQPFFNHLAKASGAADKESIKPATKAINELETLLSHLQQDTDIPQVEIISDKNIAAAVTQVCFCFKNCMHIGDTLLFLKNIKNKK